MELSWSTFVLEIVNFLILVWILKRFLYQPVLDVIARRRAGVERTLAEAAARGEEAALLKSQYENRLADWERERESARTALREELEAERARRVEEVRAEIASEREKARVAEERRVADLVRGREQAALANAAVFAARVLGQASGPEVHARLVEIALADLAALGGAERDEIRRGCAGVERAVVTCAVDPGAAERARLEAALAALLGRAIGCEFRADPDLVAGLRVDLGPWVLAADVRDDLAGLADLAHER